MMYRGRDIEQHSMSGPLHHRTQWMGIRSFATGKLESCTEHAARTRHWFSSFLDSRVSPAAALLVVLGVFLLGNAILWSISPSLIHRAVGVMGAMTRDLNGRNLQTVASKPPESASAILQSRLDDATAQLAKLDVKLNQAIADNHKLATQRAAQAVPTLEHRLPLAPMPPAPAPMPPVPQHTAVCVSGQLTRLELRSKMANLVDANLAGGNRMHLFVVLTNDDENNEVNHESTRETVTSKHFDPSGRLALNVEESGIHVHGHPTQLLGNGTHRARYVQHGKTVGDLQFKLTVHLQPRRQQFFWHKERAKQIGGAAGAAFTEEDWARRIRKERLHMLQWFNVGDCMRAVEKQEQHSGAPFDSVIRLRDDGIVFQPLIITAEHSRQFTSSSCQTWDGMHDNVMVIGRPWASCFLKGLADWHPPESAVFRNSESWMKYVAADICRAPLKTTNLCGLPVLSAQLLSFGPAMRKKTMRNLRTKAMYQECMAPQGPNVIPYECSDDTVLHGLHDMKMRTPKGLFIKFDY